MPTDQERYDQGMAVRRAVLSDAHVDRATAAATDLTTDWQDFITRVAWGDVWSRPGLDRRSRSIAVLSSLIAHGHHEELAMHLRAALRNGLTVDEIREVILQSAIYSGVPAANTAFRIASQVFSAPADEAAAETPVGADAETPADAPASASGAPAETTADTSASAPREGGAT
ncbi:4-carboxymuconolactone decarboxylase [Microbacterium enclense]|uniref:3-oxoadipate enol-lactonase / 4-carboxymuconolactone decarboxylase n=1 Tax=Microbacterium enclense TaxID=993073 RepID=A0A1G6IPT2_9MICO|nr:3-oxoadipate enol-lactonase / 4-carboxymuconolactone decarboxylase [Microbacterium enclense]